MLHPSHLSRRRLLSLAGATGAALLTPPGLIKPANAAPLPAIDEKDAIFAFGHVGPITDEGWTWSHNEGMKAIQAAYPKIKMLMVENIPYSADATRIFRQFVSQGAHMVFSTSNYGDFFSEVAARAPRVGFLEATAARSAITSAGIIFSTGIRLTSSVLPRA